MARRYVPQIFDDLDGTELTESDATEIHFTVDGTAYMLEVSEGNARKFHEVLEPFISSATKESGRGRRRSSYRNNVSSEATKARNRAIRKWANDNGYNVAPRGQIKKDIIEAYDRAHPVNKDS
ncbi:Lsr2 family protein [Corynebacterium kroppenstedtii]|uniref:histone-like nucleoid-structuring protein Lsr2 n=1 Tax=Corynebacterium sp. PCR 32 TaxID=3351342 RepID=UPI0030B2F12E